MKFSQYLESKISLILFYLILMFFISFTISVNFRNANSVVIYLNLGSFFFFLAYLTSEYLAKRRYYSTLEKLISSMENSVSLVLPTKSNIEEELINKMLTKLANNYLQEINDYAKKNTEYQDYLLSLVHEMKIPITAINLLLTNQNNFKTEELTKKLNEEIEKINYYVEQTLYYSRIDSFNQDYFIEEINLNDLVKERIKSVAKIFIAKKIDLKFLEEDVTIFSDYKWFSYVVDQLIGNALKYTQENGEIEITIGKEERLKFFSIKDNGSGIAPEDLTRVFKKGFTGTNNRKVGKSTGMGLYLADQLIQKLGHEIQIESKLEEGTTVKIIDTLVKREY